ncbi:uncharacterized protein C8Q71DRAFT_910337 [Rhodofomes roseus]|uniref:Uncharacterized protein n=1 Tax=Rhodofomes roseus TaxID=34475 RepID=A0A4Y9Y7Q9_9APHY|nr:uncharacterized protein C8Q71DRAFT_910337 [Rhodofomes roseus]KAH9831965.1 hypothetical protein C8Q71DRAFT_910337 [Rhodofomes roseus]TFY58546.1 hypothetical protein EVJ58_g6353 [Rhodofomes roseus]
MSYTLRSRKFCCCLPVRFGVFCSAILGIAYSTAFCVLGWLEVHKYAIKQLVIGKDELVGLVLFALAYTFMLLFSVMGLIGAIGAVRPFVKGYGVSLTMNTVFTIGIGIFWCWRLFHTDQAKCSQPATTEEEQVAHWICEKGSEAVRIIIVIVMVVVWLFQIAGCAIVFDYCGQLDDEAEAAANDYAGKDAPGINPYPPPTSNMRTTYEAQATPIMKSAYDQGSWSQDASKPPYPFAQPENSYGQRSDANV